MSYATACGCETSYYGPALTQLGSCSGSTFVLFMAMVDSLFRNNCKINDPCSRIIPQTPSTLHPQYDFIVIGGGSAGPVVAGRLANSTNVTVLLIEAGPDEPAGAQVPSMRFVGSSIDYLYKTDPEPVGCQQFADRRCTWPRGQVLGGSGVLNAMIYTRPIPKDFERWVAAGNTDWSYDKVLPYFKKSEDNRNIGKVVSAEVHGSRGPWTITRFPYQEPIIDDILKAAQQTGFGNTLDLNDGVHLTGMSLIQTNSRDGQRLTTAKAYLRPHRNNPNLHVLLNSTAGKVLIHEVNGKKSAYGVQFIQNNRTYTVNASREVILTAGVVGTPQILLLSGIGDNETLSEVGIQQVHNLTGVGKGLQDHVAFRLDLKINSTDTELLDWYSLNKYLKDSKGPLSANGILQVAGRIASNYTTKDDPDIQWFFGGYLANCAYNGEINAPADPKNPNATRIITLNTVNCKPKSKGYVKLGSNNPLAHPRMAANYFNDEIDLKVLLAGLRQTQKLLAAPALKEKHQLAITKKAYGNCSTTYTYDSDDFWICAFKYAHSPEHHQGSSCKMGPASNPEACVNQQLQLYGIDNIRIADASVLPTLPSANTQAAIVMIAERAAEFIAKKYNLNSEDSFTL